MKKTKFIISLLLCFILLVSVTACNNGENGPAPDTLVVEYNSYEEETENITVTMLWVNHDKETVSFGKNGTLYVKNGESFEKIGSVVGDNILSLLSTGDFVKVKYTPVDCKFEKGKTYKLEADANFKGTGEARTETISAEFEIK